MKKLLYLMLAAIVGISSTYAQDKKLLDTFVDKGILTPDEAVEISKSMSQVLVHAPEKAKSIQICTRMQFQYEWLNNRLESGTDAPRSGKSASGFNVRRLFFELYANLGSDWKAQILMDFGRSEASHYIADTYITKTFNYEYFNGDLQLGYRRPLFVYEEWLSSFSLPTIERSIANNYWAGAQNGRRLGFGGRYVGAFWWGKVKQVEGLSYTFAVTNSYNEAPWGTNETYNTADNIPNFIGGAEYALKGDEYEVKFGVSGAYGDKANKKSGVGGAKSIYGINPYARGNYKNLYFMGDFLGAVVAEGKNVGSSASPDWKQASPYGLNASVEYRFDIGEYGRLAPVFRYSWLDTGGRGVRPGDVMRHVSNIDGDEAYNNGQSFYGGLNWYIRGDNLKVMAGFEWAQYSGTPDDKHAAHRADVYAYRMQMQLRF